MKSSDWLRGPNLSLFAIITHLPPGLGKREMRLRLCAAFGAFSLALCPAVISVIQLLPPLLKGACHGRLGICDQGHRGGRGGVGVGVGVDGACSSSSSTDFSLQSRLLHFGEAPVVTPSTLKRAIHVIYVNRTTNIWGLVKIEF